MAAGVAEQGCLGSARHASHPSVHDHERVGRREALLSLSTVREEGGGAARQASSISAMTRALYASSCALATWSLRPRGRHQIGQEIDAA